MEKSRLEKLVDAISLAGFEIDKIEEEHRPYLVPGSPHAFAYGPLTGAITLRITSVKEE